MRTTLSLAALSFLATAPAFADTGAPPAGRDAPAPVRCKSGKAQVGDTAKVDTAAGKTADATPAGDAAPALATPATGAAAKPAVLSTPQLDSQALETRTPRSPPTATPSRRSSRRRRCSG